MPHQVVQVRRRLMNGRVQITPIFQFDERGNAEVDENKLSETDKQKLIAMFGIKESTQIELTDDMIRQMAKDKKIKSWHVKSIETLREEMGV